MRPSCTITPELIAAFYLCQRKAFLLSHSEFGESPHLLPERSTELFFDIEGLPDQGIYCLIGLVISSQGLIESYSFWADSPEDEHGIFVALLQTVEKYPDAPIYHYGNYELKALEHIARKYIFTIDLIIKRMVNINSLIFSKIYFPTRSNTLKDLGRFVGASWTSSDASGQYIHNAFEKILRSVHVKYRKNRN